MYDVVSGVEMGRQRYRHSWEEARRSLGLLESLEFVESSVSCAPQGQTDDEQTSDFEVCVVLVYVCGSCMQCNS